MSKRVEFYEEGLIKEVFNDNESFRRFYSTLKSIYDGKVKPGFEMAQSKKFSGASNLEPNTIDYDPVFLDILKDNKIFELLKEITGRDLVLGNVKVRMNYPTGKAYTGWHRDTVIYPKLKKGSVPPLINLNYYPCFENEPENCLLVWSKSHRKQWDSFWLDKLQVTLTRPKIKLKTSNNEFTIFDTVHLHDVAPTSYKKGAMRVIYSFCEKFQLGDKSLK